MTPEPGHLVTFLLCGIAAGAFIGVVAILLFVASKDEPPKS